MPQSLISFFSTPLLTGFVGYFTNYLAIKMLFRPYEKKWYSFGWQGVIPKNRKKLAFEVGKLVGEELFTDEELRKAIKSEHFQLVLKATIEKELKSFLSKDFGSLTEITKRFGIYGETIIESLLNNETVIEHVERSISLFLKDLGGEILYRKLGDFENLKTIVLELVKNLFENGKVKDAVSKELLSLINNFILSGKSLKDLLNEEHVDVIKEKTVYFGDKVLELVDGILSDEKVKEKIVQKLIDIKNQYFGDGFFDQLKLGVLNIFLNEETLKDVVNDKLPEFVKALKNDESVRGKIENSIEKLIDKFLNTPFYKMAEKVGMENVYSGYVAIINWFKDVLIGDVLKNRALTAVDNFFETKREYTLKGILDSAGVDVSKLIELFKVELFLNSDSVKKQMSRFVEEIFNSVHISNLYEKIPESTFDSMVVTIRDGVESVLLQHTDKIVESLRVDYLVEEKINSLDLEKVEALIFSFMKDQFKWINILGFVLGFLFGMIQSVIFLIIS